MGYAMEELVPIVGKLAERYAACGHTSMPYGQAEQLMEAVLYCGKSRKLVMHLII